MVPDIYISPHKLPLDLMSLYPPFYDEGIVYLMKEDKGKFHPVVIEYPIKKLQEALKAIK
jgi:hypothetical protein